MARTSAKKYRLWTPEANAHLVCTPAGRLPEGGLVFFLLDSAPRLDPSRSYARYGQGRRGAAPFDPAMLVCLLLYSYSVGVFSSRKIALAAERDPAFLAIVGDDRPGFRTTSDFRKPHLDAFCDIFIEVVRLAAELGMLGLGNISFGGGKILGNASRHKAMSYGYMTKGKERLKAETAALLLRAQQTDGQEDATLGCRRGDGLPAESQRREERLATINAATRRPEQQARVEAGEGRQRRAGAEAERRRSGKKRRGKEPKPVSEVPADKAQTNFTDPELKMMPQSNKGWDYAANARAGVDGMCQTIVACFVTTAANDAQQGVPLARAARENLGKAEVPLPVDDKGQVKKMPATPGGGYFSAAAVAGMEREGFDPYMATKRQEHNQAAAAAAPPPPPEEPTAKERMAAKVGTAAGKALYARRKVIVGPVFGQVKAARGFRRFSLRGMEKISGEWRPVCLTRNLLKIWRYHCAPSVN